MDLEPIEEHKGRPWKQYKRGLVIVKDEVGEEKNKIMGSFHKMI